MADTDVLFTVGLDTRDADKTAEQLQKEIESIFNSRQGQSSARLTQLEIQMKQAYDKANALREEMQRVADTPVATEEYSKLTDQLGKYENQWYSLAEKMSQFEEAGGDITSTKYQQWLNQFNQVQEALNTVRARMEQMEKDGTAFIGGKETEKYKQLQAELDKVNDKLKQQIIHYNEIRDKGSTNVNKTAREMQRLSSATERVRRSSGQMVNNLSRGLRQIIVRSAALFLGVRGLWSIIMKIRSAVMEGFKNLRESGVGQLKKQMNDLTNACTTLKNALAGAFEPIVTAIIPYIQRLVEWLTVAIDKLAQFIAAMKGQTTYIKAIKQVGNAGEKASKQLAKFDELNVLNSQGNGAAGMFEEAKIADEMIDRVAQLKAKIQEIKNALDTYIFTPIKNFLAWLIRPITDNIDKIKQAFATLWYVLEPILTAIRQAIEHTFGVLGQVYDEYIAPTMNKIMDYISRFVGVLLDFWNAHADDFRWIAEQLSAIWNESIQPVIDAAIELFGALFALIGDFITGGDLNAFATGLDRAWQTVYPTIQLSLLLVRSLAKSVSAFLVDTMKNAKLGADTIRQLLERTGSRWTTFKILVMLAVDAIRDKFNQLRDDIYTITHYGQEEFGVLIYLFQSPFVVAINLVKDAFEALKEKVESVINKVRELTGIDIMGSSPIGTFLKQLDKVNLNSINALATGASMGGIIKHTRGMASGGVIPPTASEHLVMVGDNKHETEVVSPLSTMQEAMINALQAVGMGDGQPINIYLGTDKIYSEIRKMEKRHNVMMGG